MHNGAKYTKDALETVISTLQSKGYEFVTLSELVYKDHFHMDASGKQILINYIFFSTFFNNYAILKTKFKCFRKGDFMSTLTKLKENIESVIVGKGKVIDMVMTSLIAGGHILLEDVPGTGKTVMAKSLARSLDASFSRVQFTPDLLPSDVTGLNYYNQKQGEFVFKSGPVFCNILLADEINRATPRTQSALLECMEERQVTVDGKTRPLPAPFIVIATQNPVETTGTFPLPEANLTVSS